MNTALKFISGLVGNLWLNHRKKAIAFLLGLLFAGLAAVTGIPLPEIQDAAKDAANVSAPAQIPAPVKVEQ